LSVDSQTGFGFGFGLKRFEKNRVFTPSSSSSDTAEVSDETFGEELEDEGEEPPKLTCE